MLINVNAYFFHFDKFINLNTQLLIYLYLQIEIIQYCYT
jgi:hypothetical protein